MVAHTKSHMGRGYSELDFDWMVRGLCRYVEDPNIFFPEGGSGRGGQMQADQDKAIEVCHRCPVEKDCLEFALSTRQDFGVWGGCTERERTRIRKNRAKRASRELELVKDVDDNG